MIQYFKAYIEYNDNDNDYSIEYTIKDKKLSWALAELSNKVEKLEEQYDVTLANLEFEYGIEE